MKRMVILLVWLLSKIAWLKMELIMDLLTLMDNSRQTQ